ncbi:aminoglycoside phosphotransferase family protein [Bradyrhizobium sp. CB1717]|uniref:phosphotransferase enzyme family protein n=1 Tax=Bradyrhizobium sp. CB1717 TaxID=3039154 RepID=UPI0024B0D027|nr:aminoglycoside phosphotransferase family protein [Bradyrhizobium sp. CB1717]WFU25470.1 aminoglycoside phosphotransferase family protein [Bradyrhizobium sp. CB1717]
MVPSEFHSYRAKDVAIIASQHYRLGRIHAIREVRGGIINRTWQANTEAGVFSIQIMPPTNRSGPQARWMEKYPVLQSVGINVPRLVRTSYGENSALLVGGLRCRVSTWLVGAHPTPPLDAAKIDHLFEFFARFHSAINLAEPNTRWPIADVQSTVHIMEWLATDFAHASIERDVSKIASEILGFWRAEREALKDETPLIQGHGDLQLSNIVMDSHRNFAIGLIDLDTMGFMTLADELGDALRAALMSGDRLNLSKPQYWMNQTERLIRAGISGYRQGLAAGDFRQHVEIYVNGRVLLAAMRRIIFNLAARYCLAITGRVPFRADSADCKDREKEFAGLARITWELFLRIWQDRAHMTSFCS